jgi:hypothetical protein
LITYLSSRIEQARERLCSTGSAIAWTLTWCS